MQKKIALASGLISSAPQPHLWPWARRRNRDFTLIDWFLPRRTTGATSVANISIISATLAKGMPPISSWAGGCPAAVPTGRGQLQNTRAAQVERTAKAAAKREALATRRAEAEVRMGRPRKTCSDKGSKRGPHQKKWRVARTLNN